MSKRYLKLVSGYVFSNKQLQEYDPSEQLTLELAIDILTTHGSGGKFMEKLIQHKFKLVDDGKIHGWDGATSEKRPVEIKTETVNHSKKIFCESSFGAHTPNTPRKKEVYLDEKPFLVNAGVCAKTGKCIYVMFTDTAKINPKSIFFERLDANAPRINFGHFLNDKSSYEVVYKNKQVIANNINCIREELKQELTNAARLPI
jgi:hypothetical protein